MIQPTLQVDLPKFNHAIEQRRAAFQTNFFDELKNQVRLLGRELIQRTPPFSGSSIKSMTAARGATFSDFDIEDMTARQVGMRRVEKDVRRVIYGVEKGILSTRQMVVTRGANAAGKSIYQNCEGRKAVRVFASKSGKVYGVDISDYKPDATADELRKHHSKNRNESGRVTMAGQKTRDVGRWRWLDTLVTKERVVAQYVRKAQSAVGKAKGGWASGYARAGGKIGKGGWIGKHSGEGTFIDRMEPTSQKPYFIFVNHSRWASGRDAVKFVMDAMNARATKMVEDIKHKLDKAWK